MSWFLFNVFSSDLKSFYVYRGKAIWQLIIKGPRYSVLAEILLEDGLASCRMRYSSRSPTLREE